MEVEIKLVCKDLAALRKKLLAIGAVLEKAKTQVDVYYNHPSKVLVESGQYLRVRIAGDKKTLAHHINLADGINDECEVEMDADGEIEMLLGRLGFPKLGVIDKERDQYRLGEFNICLDAVKDIGNFVEIEMEVEKNSDQKETVKKCWQLAEKLGFTKKDKFGYWLCDIAVGKVRWPK